MATLQIIETKTTKNGLLRLTYAIEWENSRLIETRSGFDVLRVDSEGSCDACGLPLRVRGSFRVPGAPGKFCSVLCIECGLFSGHGLCRWCGDELDSNRGFFCSERGRKQSEGVRFGDGTRLLNFLERNQPELYKIIAGQHGCLNCGGSLADRRAGSNSGLSRTS